MSYLNKKYIDLLDTDYSEFIKTKEDADLFDKMVEHEKKTVGVPANECIHDVIAALNIMRQLQGIKAKVMYQCNPNLN